MSKTIPCLFNEGPCKLDCKPGECVLLKAVEDATRQKTTARARVLRSMALRQAERDIEHLARSHWAASRAGEPWISWFRVYALADPRNGEVFYIGKSNFLKERLKGHIREALAGMRTPKCDRIREILRAGADPEIRTIALTTGNVLRLERRLINEMADVLTNDKPARCSLQSA